MSIIRQKLVENVSQNSLNKQTEKTLDLISTITGEKLVSTTLIKLLIKKVSKSKHEREMD